jgi:opacity protein-like surface antigen
MILSRSLLGLLTALGVASVATSAAAQEAPYRPYRFGVQGGLSLPQGDVGDAFDNGFTVGATLDLALVNRPFGLRFDVGYHRYGVVDAAEALGLDATFSVIPITAAAVVAIPTTSGVRPYLLGGLGMYVVRGSVTFDESIFLEGRAAEGAAVRPSLAGAAGAAGVTAARETYSDSETKFGLHGGAGLGFRLGTLDAYLEARYHSVFTEETNTSFVPIVFGVRF